MGGREGELEGGGVRGCVRVWGMREDVIRGDLEGGGGD